jgi:hypothetical protein
MNGEDFSAMMAQLRGGGGNHVGIKYSLRDSQKC